MKKIIILMLVGFVIVSCHDESDIRYYRGWFDTDYYQFTFKDTILIGKIFDIYHRDIDSVEGKAKKDSISWNINIDRKDGSYYYNGLIDKKGNIQLGDSLAITLITKKEFDSIIKEAFHPKLINKQKVFLLDDFIIDIKVKGWDYHDSKGETIVFIKDKKTKNLLQTIKSKDFVFDNEIFFGYKDLNFDQKKDLSFYIGNVGNRCSSASNYYLFNPKKKQFEYNEDFSFIMNQVGKDFNEKDKTITSYSTGSCCTHYADKYKVHGNKFTKIKKMLIEDNADITVTIEELKNNKWIKLVNHYPLKSKIDFYKNF